eukprot:s4619_g1.t1
MPPSSLADGDLATVWAAPCPSGVACGAEGAWLEAQLRVPSIVRCLRLFQSTAWSSAVIALESGSGTVYTNVSRFSQLSGGSWEHLARWEVANKALGSMSRAGGLADRRDRALLGRKLLLLAGLRDLRLGWFRYGPGRRWGSHQRAATLVASGTWLGRYEGTETLHRLAWPWLGLSTADGVMPLCLRLLQANESLHFANDLVLQRWSGSAWLDYQVSLSGIGTIAPHFTELGVGRHVHRVFRVIQGRKRYQRHDAFGILVVVMLFY